MRTDKRGPASFAGFLGGARASFKAVPGTPGRPQQPRSVGDIPTIADLALWLHLEFRV